MIDFTSTTGATIWCETDSKNTEMTWACGRNHMEYFAVSPAEERGKQRLTSGW
jgi:hypothetical protein